MARTYPDGVCTVEMYDSDGVYLVPASEYERLLAEWKSGAAFIHWTGFYGQVNTVKGARVQNITAWEGDSWDRSTQASKADALTGTD